MLTKACNAHPCSRGLREKADTLGPASSICEAQGCSVGFVGPISLWGNVRAQVCKIEPGVMPSFTPAGLSKHKVSRDLAVCPCRIVHR